MYDTGHEIGGPLHQLEELDVVVAVEGRVDGQGETDLWRFADLVTKLLDLPGMTTAKDIKIVIKQKITGFMLIQ